MDGEMKIDIYLMNALEHLSTKPEEARRRTTNEDNEDWFLENLNPFVADLIQVFCSKAWRRLESKTQVLTDLLNAHIRHRGAHSLEVLAIAVSISEFLGLNTELCRAIAVGHDLGHTPFGHAGEKFIADTLQQKWQPSSKGNKPDFRHEVFGVIVYQAIERLGKGLNLTHQTLEGILYHSRGKNQATTNASISQEANAVMFADKISYILSDFNDLFQRGLLLKNQHQALVKLMMSCGKNQRLRTWYFVSELCKESAQEGKISFSKCVAAQQFEEIKRMMYGVYDKVNMFESQDILKYVYDFLDYVSNKEFNPLLALALMTDDDVLYLHRQQCLILVNLKETSIWELVPLLKKRKALSLTNPDLNW